MIRCMKTSLFHWLTVWSVTKFSLDKYFKLNWNVPLMCFTPSVTQWHLICQYLINNKYLRNKSNIICCFWSVTNLKFIRKKFILNLTEMFSATNLYIVNMLPSLSYRFGNSMTYLFCQYLINNKYLRNKSNTICCPYIN